MKLLNFSTPSGGVVNVIVPDVQAVEHPDVPGGYVAGFAALNGCNVGSPAQPQRSRTCCAMLLTGSSSISATSPSIRGPRIANRRLVSVVMLMRAMVVL